MLESRASLFKGEVAVLIVAVELTTRQKAELLMK